MIMIKRRKRKEKAPKWLASSVPRWKSGWTVPNKWIKKNLFFFLRFCGESESEREKREEKKRREEKKKRNFLSSSIFLFSTRTLLLFLHFFISCILYTWSIQFWPWLFLLDDIPFYPIYHYPSFILFYEDINLCFSLHQFYIDVKQWILSNMR